MKTPPLQPTPLPIVCGGIPEELKKFPQWVLWMYQWKTDPKKPAGGSWTKKPVQVVNPRIGADSRDPSTWSTFDDAWAAYARLAPTGVVAGMGFCPTPENNLTGVDLDHVLKNGVVVDEKANAALELLKGTYIEPSPSGTGLRAFCLARKPGSRCKSRNYEMYDGRTADGKPGGRFLTVTGQRYGDPAPIIDKQTEIDTLYKEWFGEAKPSSKKKVSTGPTTAQDYSSLTHEDHELIKVIHDSPNGAKFKKLYSGDWSSYGSESEADFALLRVLGFWTNYDAGRTDRLFRHSRLMRAKWDDPRGKGTLGQLNISNSFEGKQPGDGYKGKPKVDLDVLTRDPDRLLNKPYLQVSDLADIPIDKKIIVIQSPTGTNKTGIINAQFSKKTKVLELTNRNSLVGKAAHARGAADFRAVKVQEASQSMVCSLDSVHHVTTQNYEGCEMVFDEATSSLDHLYGDTIALHLGDTLNSLKLLCRYSNRIWALDAGMTDETLEHLMELTGAKTEEVFFIKNEWREPHGKGKVFFHTSKDALVAQLVRNVNAGKKAAVACDSLRQSRKVAKRLGRIIGLRVKVINSRTAAAEVQDLLNNPEILRDFDVLVFTPTIFSGADLTFLGEGHFDTVFCIRLGNHLSPDYIYQAINRVRDIKDRTVHIFAKEYSSFLETNSSALYRSYEEKRDKVLGIFEPHDHENRLTIAARYCKPIQIHLRRVARQNAAKMNFVSYLKALLESKDYEIMDAAVDETSARVEKTINKEVAQEVEDERVEGLERARALTDEEAADLKGSDGLSSADKDALERYYYKGLNGGVETGLTEVFAHDFAQLRSQTHALENLSTDDSTLKRIQVKLNPLSRLDPVDIITPTNIRRQLDEAIGGWNQTLVITPERLAAFVEVAKRLRYEIKDHLGIDYTCKNLDDPKQWRQSLNRYLKTLGLSTVIKSKKIAGKAVRMYSINPDEQTFWSNLLDRREAARIEAAEKDAKSQEDFERWVAEEDAQIDAFWAEEERRQENAARRI